MNKTLIFTLTYSRLNYLRQMIASLEDTVFDYEDISHLFIVNGCKETLNYLKSHMKPRYAVQYNKFNMGIPWSWNFGAKTGIENGYKIICKVDDDAILKTKGWLKDSIKVIDKFKKPLVLSPTVNGLVNFPKGMPRYLKMEINGIELGFVNHLGGITQITTPKVYKIFKKFDTNVPLHSSQDLRFSQELRSKGVYFAYIEGHSVSHGPKGTADQEIMYPKYFEQRKIERKTTLKEIEE